MYKNAKGVYLRASIYMCFYIFIGLLVYHYTGNLGSWYIDILIYWYILIHMIYMFEYWNVTCACTYSKRFVCIRNDLALYFYITSVLPSQCRNYHRCPIFNDIPLGTPQQRRLLGCLHGLHQARIFGRPQQGAKARHHLGGWAKRRKWGLELAT